MADYKDYIVRYDIQANVTQAAEGLRAIADIAKQFEGPMQTLSKAITQVSQAAFQLKQNSQIIFAPKIDVAGFNNQLRKMVVDVRAAATEMHTALFQALSGNPAATAAMKKGANSALSSPKNIAQIKRDIESYERELDKIYGTRKKNKKGETIRNRDGSIFYAKKANMHDRVSELEGQGKAIRQRISQLKADMAALEKLEKEAAIATTKSTGKKTTAVAKSQPAPLTNVTPAVIRQWKDAFGDARLKNLTINIRGNASGPKGAMTVIEQILTSLRALQKQASFTINPLLNPEGFAAAEAQLRSLAGLSAKVVAPFGGKTGTGTTGKGRSKGGKAGATGMKPLAVDIVGNVTSILPPKTELVVPVVGEMIKIQNKATEAIPVNVKITQGSITESLKGVKIPPIPAHLKLGWEKGAIGRQQQLKGITEKLPPITLILDTTAAVAKLEEFIALVKANSPQNIALTASGNAKNGAATAGTGKGSKGHQAASAMTPREYRDKLGQHLSKGFALPPNYATQIADQERTRKWHLDKMRRDAMAAFAQKTPYELAEEEHLRKLAPTTAGTGKGKVVWGNQAPAGHTAPKGYKWVRDNDLTKYLTPAQQQELARLQGLESKAAQKVRDMQSRIARSTGKSNTRLSQPRAQYDAIEKQLAPWRQQMAQLEEMKKPFASLKKLNAAQKKALARITAAQAPIAAQIDQLTAQQAPFAAAIQRETALMSRYQSMSSRAVTAAQQQHAQASSAVSRYTSGWRLAESNPRGVASPGNIQRANALQAQFHNSMLPFGLNKSQMDIVKKYRRFFRQGATVSGITPVAGMQAAQMAQYLQAVSTQMQAANVPVPVQLQSYIDKLGKQTAGTSGRSSSYYPATVTRKPFFDRARKWAYPFTGQTSFGVRTPMAVDMAKGMGVMFAIGGAMSAIGSSFSQAMEYQNTMRTTQAILQNGTESYSQGAFRNMEATVREVGVKTKFSAPEVASAARFLAMAGYDIDAINASIRPIADLALIGDSDLGETADKMTNIMTTFGIKPGQMRAAANIMATTATRSNTDLMMLAESAKYGGGVANMYGRNDPNLFADTMALFGVMGNAGIQASSAGTALRMMYQNIFKPNKNQRKVLDMMKSQYGISTLNADGSYRAMSSILTEMAQRIPENKMAEIVGNLFRITAQPGAAATLMAAAGGDKGVAEEIGVGIEAMSAKMSSKAGLSSLVSLMLANRESINGNISGAIAEEKQNTIAGLWAQVTSTFTEGIVQAFEQRQGGFEGMLKGLRDYLAKPETIQMLQNLLDMVIEIGKVMAWFIKIWANLYNMCPGLIKFWVVAQMAFTQIGTLIAPFISLIGVFNRLGGVLARLAGVSTLATTTTSRAVAGAAGASALNAPFMVGTGRFGRANVIRGNAAVRANRAIANNAILASELALSGADVAATRTALNAETRQHYAAVQARAKRMYGWARVGRAFKGGLNATLTAASVAPVFGGISKLFMGLMTGLAKAVGLLCNPITLAIAAAGGLAYGIYKLKQHMDGATEAQIQSRKVANQAADQTSRELKKEGKWYQDMMSENIPEAAPVISSIDTARIKEAEEQKARFNQIYSTIFNDFSKDASKQSVNDVATKWRSAIAANPAYFLALKGARNYDFTKKHKQLEYNPYDDSGNGAVALWNLWHADEDNAINQRNGMVQDALMIEGANDARTQQAIREITELRAKYLRGETTYKTQAEYVTAANAIRDKYLSLFTARLSAAGMTPEQFQQTSNRSVYDTYQLGATNFINATINGDLGTLVGNINAREWLADTKNKAKIYTDEWYNAISHIIGDYHVIYNAVSADGKQSANIELILSTLPNGRLNFTNILDQIREKIANFNLTIQGFSDIIGTAYKMMADAGIVDLNDRNGMQKFIRQNLTGAKYGDSTPRQYYQQWIANNPNSEWVRAGISEKQYVDFIMGRSGETIDLGNQVVSRSTEKSQMWNNMSRKTADTIINQNKQKSGGGPKPNIPTKPVSTHTPAPSTSTPSAGTQDAYASHYDKSAARPTVVNININELAHFDRTSVASSAQERDLMAAMEEKIAESIYRLSMTALNNVSGYMA